MSRIGMIAVILSLMISGCYYDTEEDLYQVCNPDNLDTSNVTFSGDIMPIIQGNCAISGCHVQGGTGNGIFSNYAGVKEKVNNGELENRVLIQKNMPPSQPLSECNQKLIRAWINAGAPNN